MASLMLLPLLLAAAPWPDSVVTIHLEFDPGQWAYACEHPDEEIPVDAGITIGGWSSDCTMQIRGQTSAYYPKKSIKVRILGGGSFCGFDEFNLNAQYSDRSRIRENLSYLFHGACGQITPATGMTRVFFNGVTQGPYLFVEDIDGDFARRTWLPDDAVIYKCREYGASLDSPYHLDLYRKKTFEDQPTDDLEWLICWLGAAPDSLFLADVSRWVHLDDLLTCAAVNTLIGHGSTYYHNYHMVLDGPGLFGRWRMIAWDMDKTWGGSSYGPDLPYYWVTNDISSPNTLMWRLWCTPHTRGLLMARLAELSVDFAPWTASGVVDSLEALVEPLVQEDPFRDYTMEEFHQSVQVIRDWPAERLQNLEQMYDLWPLPFRLYPTVLRGDGSILARWSRAERSSMYRAALSTDSTFLDQSAVFWETVTPDTFLVFPGRSRDSDDTFLQVRAFNQYREERALNRSVHLAPDPAAHRSGTVVINEVFYRDGDYVRPGDWIELANAGDEEVNLAGWSIRDTEDRNLFVLGDETVPAGGFLVLVCDPEAFEWTYPPCQTHPKTLHFGLSADGEVLRLYDHAGNMADYVPYQSAPPWPGEPADGGWSLSLISTERDNSEPGSWTATPHGGTPGLPNGETPPWTPEAVIFLSGVTPNPAFDMVTVRVSAAPAGPCVVRVFDLAGRQVAESLDINIGPSLQSVSMDVGGLPPGIYFLHVSYAGLKRSSAFIKLAGSP